MNNASEICIQNFSHRDSVTKFEGVRILSWLECIYSFACRVHIYDFNLQMVVDG